jgi:short-subunit dehydrogenase
MTTRQGAFMAALGLAATVGPEAVRRTKRFDLRGRVALVTGGSRGLGLVLARTLSKRGARVIILARERDELERARTRLRSDRSLNAEVLTIECDVSDRDGVRDAVKRAEAWHGRIDVLVNVAGVIMVGPLDADEDTAFERAMAINSWGPYNMVRAVAPRMRRQGGGRIVNIASIGGIVAVPHLAPYSASKFALAGLSEALHSELATDGIVVTTVFPGLMRTGSGRAAELTGNARAENAWFRASSVMPLLAMPAEDAARRIVRALEHGDAHVILGAPAKLLALAHGIAPNLVAWAMKMATRLLPSAEGAQTAPTPGTHFEAPTAWLRRRDDEYAAANNEPSTP